MIGDREREGRRIAVFYFSGTGNTRWVAQMFETAARSLGSVVTTTPIRDNMAWPPDLCAKEPRSQARPGSQGAAPDVVVVAHPVYGGDPPPIVKRFYTRLSKLYHGDVAVILTYGYVASISRRRERKFLSGSLRWFRGVKMVNNITTPEMPVRLPDAKTRTRRLARASRKLRRMARRVVSNRRGLPQVRPAAAAGPIVRRIMGNAVREHYRQVAVDRDRCVLCKLCVEQCPTNSITYREGGFDVADTCTACMACYNFCPVQAITIGGVYADPERYPRYRGPEPGLTREHGVGRDHR